MTLFSVSTDIIVAFIENGVDKMNKDMGKVRIEVEAKPEGKFIKKTTPQLKGDDAIVSREEIALSLLRDVILNIRKAGSTQEISFPWFCCVYIGGDLLPLFFMEKYYATTMHLFFFFDLVRQLMQLQTDAHSRKRNMHTYFFSSPENHEDRIPIHFKKNN